MRRSILIALFAATLAGCSGRYVGVYASIPPPPIRVEASVQGPGRGFTWIRGYWAWGGGTYGWVPGRWERIPQGRRRWEEGRWQRRGDRYYWRDGRWR
jgi:hypothetical protein